MTTYKEIFGKPIKVVSSDPTDSGAEGQVWYNSTLGSFRSVVASGAWVSAASSTNGGASRIGFGIQTAGIAAGGSTAPGNQTVVEEYNGSGWSTETALPVSRQDGGGAGTTTAGVVWCGEGPGKLNTTQEYDGSSWTTTGTYPITARGVRGSGTQTAAIGDGGDTPAPAASNVSAEYNGSTWTAGNNLPGNRIAAATSGPQTAALATTGKDNTPNPSVSNLNTSYDGTTWTAETVYPLSLRQAVSTGTSSAANLVAGGVAAVPFGDATTKANSWDGSSWTAVGDLGTKSTHGNGAGSSTASYINSGVQDYPSYPGVTQEYNFTTNTITAAAWSSGGSLGTARYQIGGAGDLPAGLAYGGYGTGIGANTNKTEEYNGTSWSEQNDMANTRGQCSGQHIGTQTAALAAGGTLPGSPNYGSACEEYNGTSWTAGGALTEDSGRSYVAGFGTQTAGVAAGGYAQTGATSNSEEYDGSSWTAGNNRNNPASASSGTGTQTAGLAVGIYPNSSNVEEYDGTNWTNVTAYPAGRFGVFGGMGTQTDSIHAGGSASTTRTTETFGYDGTSWSTRPALGTALSSGASGGTSTSAFIAGGRGSPPGPTAGVTTTEEFTGETTATNIVDITTS